MNRQSVLSSFQYQLRDTTRSVVIYYIVIACVLVLSNVLIATAASIHGAGGMMVFETGTGFVFMASMIFLFVLGLNTFKENFGMLLQNGCSRKSVFWGRNLAAATLALFMALADTLLSGLASLVARGISGADYYGAFFAIASSTGASFSQMAVPLQILLGIPLAFAAYLFFITLGYFITILFYRLNRTGKIIVGAGVPVFFLIVFPTIDALFLNGGITQFINGYIAGPYYELLLRYPALNIVSYLCWACLFALFSWLLMRKAVVRK